MAGAQPRITTRKLSSRKVATRCAASRTKKARTPAATLVAFSKTRLTGGVAVRLEEAVVDPAAQGADAHEEHGERPVPRGR